MRDEKSRLARLLYAKSYMEGQVTLTSGRKSNYYFDCKQTALDSEGSWLLGKTILQSLNPDIQGVGGMTLGADPLITAVTVLSYLENRPLPGFIVRKEPKKHGTQEYLEGLINFNQGCRVAVLEDAVTTGGSILKACARVQAAGLVISQVLCILDREEGGRELLLEQGYQLDCIFTRNQLLSLASS